MSLTSVTTEIQLVFAEAMRIIDKARLEIVMHPDDVTDEVRAACDAEHLVTLHESKFVKPGTALLIRPGLIEP